MALPMFTIQTFNQSILQPAGAVFAQRVKAKEQYPNVVALVDVMLTFSNIGNDASSMFIAGQISATALVRAPSKAAPTPTPITGGRRTRVYHNKRRTKQEKTRRR